MDETPMTAAEVDSVPSGDAGSEKVRTAVVIVHGMGEQLPLETLNGFVRTALAPTGGKRRYFSRPARLTDSYEARRHLAFPQTHDGELVHGQTEFFEYHWSYLMTGNRLGDLLPTMRRLLFRRPSMVPYGLRVVWWIVWVLLLALVASVIVLLVVGAIDEFTFFGVTAAILGPGVVAVIVIWVVKRLGGVVTASFVDVVRYLDRSPRSYEVRRAIRKGMVDLLQAIHDDGRYSRIVLVAHSLGAYIAYDGICALWPEMAKLHCGPIDTAGTRPLPGLPELEAAAEAVRRHPAGPLDPVQHADLEEFRARQSALWTGLRRQGNPWLVTDFVSVGTPMYFADLLYTRNRGGFDQLVKSAELPLCPPRHRAQTVEAEDYETARYGWNNRGRTVLADGAPFAVVRWTNLYFPAERSFFGDWFGGPLRPLFGNGIQDRPLTGNLPGRRTPGFAHGRYFDYPDASGPEDVASVLRHVLDLGRQDDLVELLTAPGYLEESRRTP